MVSVVCGVRVGAVFVFRDCQLFLHVVNASSEPFVVRPFEGENVFPDLGCLVSGCVCARANFPRLGVPLVSTIASSGLEMSDIEPIKLIFGNLHKLIIDHAYGASLILGFGMFMVPAVMFRRFSNIAQSLPLDIDRGVDPTVLDALSNGICGFL